MHLSQKHGNVGRYQRAPESRPAERFAVTTSEEVRNAQVESQNRQRHTRTDLL